MSKELKPCPFCGSEAKIKKTKEKFLLDEFVEYYSVFCTNCCCETQYSSTEEETVKDWNRRADNGKLQRLLTH